jgi:hypothetical protein
MIKSYFKFIIIIVFVLSPVISFGANLIVSSSESSLDIGDVFIVDITLDTKNQSVNAIEGVLSYDNSVLKPVFINTGSSALNMWLVRPILSMDGIIKFSGITPGGVNSGGINIFSVSFESISPSASSVVSVGNLSVYLNDGLGSSIPVSVGSFPFSVSSLSSADSNFIIQDDTGPESFSITRAKDFSIYDNKYFVSFNPIDKGSGVSRVVVCEFFNCYESNSPSLLRNQNNFYFIRVTAFDINENSKTEFLISNLFYFVVFIFFIFIIFSYLFFVRRKM